MYLDSVEFTEEGVLYTLGNNVRLHIKNLVSKKGKITTFPKNAIAAFGHDGRSGGNIFVTIDNAEGHLSFELRGENGGEGLKGPTPDESLKGPTGAFRSLGKNPFICLGLPGESGGQGRKGFTGMQGQRGGDSGTLELIVKAGEKFTSPVDIQKKFRRHRGRRG